MSNHRHVRKAFKNKKKHKSRCDNMRGNETKEEERKKNRRT